nr:immunoglobulin heavy chain junction region [Mus musculus]
CGTHLHG